MRVDLTIKNYRCFSDGSPARFEIREGFLAFVGPNNCGKSTVLKLFYELRGMLGALGVNGDGNFPTHQNGGKSSLSNYVTSTDLEQLFFDRNERDVRIEMSFPGQRPDRVDIILERVTKTWKTEVYDHGQVLTGGVGWASPAVYRWQQGTVDMSQFMEICQILANCFYVGPYRNAINVGTNSSYFDIQVGQAFITNWRQMKTGSSKLNSETALKLTQDIKRIFGFEYLEINPNPDNTTMQLFVNGRSYTLSELGAGLSQFILVLANVAQRRPSFVLIDEPELHLHPSLQMDFLTTVGAYATHGVLYATHSLGLARATADWIYSVRKGAHGSQIRPLETTPRLPEFLGELSFSGYRDIGYNKVLLVEGGTEVKTLQQFLRLLGKDHQVVMLPLGGSTLINGTSEAELQEITRISDSIVALIDSERTGPNQPLDASREDFRRRCEQANIACHILERRAIENYFTDAAVKLVKGSKYRALQPYEKVTDMSPSWSKSENWKIAREMDLHDLDGTDLGDFLYRL